MSPPFILIERADERVGHLDIGAEKKIRFTVIGVNQMPFETLFSVPGAFAVTITATVVDQNGVAPSTIIRANENWSVRVNWRTTGIATGMISGTWHLHAYLESIGPGVDLDLFDPNDLNIP